MIHPSAVIEEGVELGADVSVGPGAFIESGAVIGDGCKIAPNAVIYGCVTLGKACKVHAGAVLGDAPQDLAYEGGDSRVSIGEGCTLREGVTVHRGTKDGTTTVIGEHCFLMGLSHFAHNVTLAPHVIVANGSVLGGYVQVGERAFISGNVAVHQFVKIGRLAMVGGSSGISKDIPPFCMTQPVTLNSVIGLNTIGMRRSGMSLEERQDVQRAFKVLYLSGLNASQARERLQELFVNGPASEFAAFIEDATRGLSPCVIQRTVSLEV